MTKEKEKEIRLVQLRRDTAVEHKRLAREKRDNTQ